MGLWLPRRLLASLSLAVAALLVAAPAATAADGVGLWGRLDDKVITFWGFGVIAFFVILPIVLSVIQARRESAKERAREEIEREWR